MLCKKWPKNFSGLQKIISSAGKSSCVTIAKDVNEMVRCPQLYIDEMNAKVGKID